MGLLLRSRLGLLENVLHLMDILICRDRKKGEENAKGNEKQLGRYCFGGECEKRTRDEREL